jgi:two-component system, cell cycle sensor histidine kinase and response regulator CckA
MSDPSPAEADMLDQLREQEARLRAVVDAAVDAVITINERGVVESVNRAAEAMFGYPAAEVMGHNIAMLMPAPYRGEHDGYLARYLATGEQRVIGIGREVVGRRKDGSTFPIELAVGEWRTETRRGFTGFIRDITDRKRNEALLREQADLLDRVAEAIMVRDRDDRITYWNKGAERMYGWTAEEVHGRLAWEILGSSPTAIRLAEAQLEATGEWSGEFRRTTRTGRVLTVESLWTLLRDAEGNPVGKVAINIDVTEKRLLETRSRRAQRLESVGTLTSGIAHDLNNVLTPVMMAVKLLGRDKPGIDRRALLDTANASLERGADLIRQLLAFAGGLEGERLSVDLKAVVTEVAAMLRQTLPKSIVLRTEVGVDVWPVVGDSTQLSQVVMNLCVNSRDAMPEGGALDVTVENKRLNVDAAALFPGAKSGPYVVLAVADTGTGMSPEVQEKMFDPFFTTKPFGQGTGLGLSTTLGIVRSHHGFLNVYSEPGRGTRLSVYLPAADRAATPVERAEGDGPTGSGELILVVDDEAAILTAAHAVLEAGGYRVMTAGSGDEAVAVFQLRTPESLHAPAVCCSPWPVGPRTRPPPVSRAVGQNCWTTAARPDVPHSLANPACPDGDASQPGFRADAHVLAAIPSAATL